MKRAETRNGRKELLARASETLERDLVPKSTEVGVDALLGPGLIERRDRALPDRLVEELERAPLCETGSLEVGLGENGVDGAIDFHPVGHEGAEARSCL